MEYGLSADVYVNISFTLFIFHTYSILFNLMFRKKEEPKKESKASRWPVSNHILLHIPLLV